MSKLNLIGLILCAAGVVTAIFQGVQSMMTAGEIVWKQLALVDIFDEAYFYWIDDLSSAFLQNALNVFVSLPVSVIFIVLGLVFLIIEGLIRK